MSYARPCQMGTTVLITLFVDPVSYKAVLEAGTWPDKTILVLETPWGPRTKGLDQ